jgi:hypothetical protein
MHPEQHYHVQIPGCIDLERHKPTKRERRLSECLRLARWELRLNIEKLLADCEQLDPGHDRWQRFQVRWGTNLHNRSTGQSAWRCASQEHDNFAQLLLCSARILFFRLVLGHRLDQNLHLSNVGASKNLKLIQWWTFNDFLTI